MATVYNMATFVLGIGNRGFFPPKYMEEARRDLPQILSSLGHDSLMMPEEATRLGAVETKDEGDKFAQFLRDNQGKYDGVIWTHPNFGNEVGMSYALREEGKRRGKILLHGYPDDMDKLGPDDRRDAFCGIVSTMDVLYQMGVRFVKLAPHVVSPKSERFAENIDLFARICAGTSQDPYKPVQPECCINGRNVLEGMVVLALGARTTPFYTTRFNELDAEKNGIRVETEDLSSVFHKMDQIKTNDPRYELIKKRLLNYTCWDKAPDLEHALDQQARFAIVMEEYVTTLKPDAIGVRCWTEFQQIRGISPCATMSYLNHFGIPTACEVDLGNAIAMAVMKKFGADAVACQDWNNNFFEDDNKFMFMHCGPHDTAWLKPGHYVATHGILDHAFGKNRGVGCIQGRFEPTDFTYGSCASENGKLKFYFGDGRVTEDELPSEYFGSAGVAEIARLQDVLLHVGHGGYKHHFSMGRGLVADKIISALRQHPGYEVTDMRKV